MDWLAERGASLKAPVHEGGQQDGAHRRSHKLRPSVRRELSGRRLVNGNEVESNSKSIRKLEVKEVVTLLGPPIQDKEIDVMRALLPQLWLLPVLSCDTSYCNDRRVFWSQMDNHPFKWAMYISGVCAPRKVKVMDDGTEGAELLTPSRKLGRYVGKVR